MNDCCSDGSVRSRRSPRYSLGWVLASASLFVWLGCGAQGDRTARGGRFSQAAHFTLEDLQGRQVSLDQYRGQVVFLDFWATWCPPCRATIPLVQRLSRKFTPKGVAVLGLSVDEDHQAVADFAKSYDIQYPILLAGDSGVSDQYGVRGIPTFVIIDQAGRVRRRFSGYHEGMEHVWDRLITELVAASAEPSTHARPSAKS